MFQGITRQVEVYVSDKVKDEKIEEVRAEVES